MKVKILMYAAWIFAMIPSSQLAAQESETKTAGSVSVSGTATMDIEADCVSIQIISEHTKPKARDAYNMTVEEMSEALELLKKRKDITNLNTTQIMLHPRVKDYKSGEKEYNARQVLSFELTKLEAYDELMLSLIDLGINGIGQVQFKSSKADEYEEVLMRKAVQDARKKAVILASELGQEVGRATMINEQSAGMPRPMMDYKMSLSSEMSGPSVAPGSLTIGKTVHIQFELK